jgi:hypothetical protein
MSKKKWNLMILIKSKVAWVSLSQKKVGSIDLDFGQG